MVSILKPQESGVTRNSAKAGLNLDYWPILKLNEQGYVCIFVRVQVLLAGKQAEI